MSTANLKIDLIHKITQLKESYVIEEINRLLYFRLCWCASPTQVQVEKPRFIILFPMLIIFFSTDLLTKWHYLITPIVLPLHPGKRILSLLIFKC